MTSMPAPSRPTAVTAAQIRRAMFGETVPGLIVVRQAWRVTDDDSDELVLVEARGQWWVAQRVSDRLTVWAFAGDDEADAGFERMLHEAHSAHPAWQESRERAAGA